MNREIVVLWIDKVSSSDPGETIALAAENRQHAKDLAKLFRKEIKILTELDPVKASRIQLAITVKDGRFWLELQRTFGSPLVGFKKGKDGRVERISILDPDRYRRLTLMQEDGLSLEEVEAIEGELNDDERKLFI